MKYLSQCTVCPGKFQNTSRKPYNRSQVAAWKVSTLLRITRVPALSDFMKQHEK
jgi:hypothetical protein